MYSNITQQLNDAYDFAVEEAKRTKLYDRSVAKEIETLFEEATERIENSEHHGEIIEHLVLELNHVLRDNEDVVDYFRQEFGGTHYY